MATNPPSSVKVTIGQNTPKVTTVNYGGIRSLAGSTDLNLSGAQDGDVIVYSQSQKLFYVENIGNAITTIDNGYF
jgi:hypothetical protein